MYKGYYRCTCRGVMREEIQNTVSGQLRLKCHSGQKKRGCKGMGFPRGVPNPQVAEEE